MATLPEAAEANQLSSLIELFEEHKDLFDDHPDLAKGLFHISKDAIENCIKDRSFKRKRPRDEAKKLYNDRYLLRKAGCTESEVESLCGTSRNDWPSEILARVRGVQVEAVRKTRGRHQTDVRDRPEI